MRRLTWIVCSALLLALPASADDRWILAAGTAGAFRTDARIFNPSFEKDIQVTAHFLRTDTDNAGTMAGPGTTVTIPKRSMSVLNDVVTTLFGIAPPILGAIHFTSPDPFEVTSRIYAPTPTGTAGQFGPGVATTAARTKGAILQLRDNGQGGQQGTFRSNIGVVNSAASPTVINWVLYDRNNAIVGSGTTTLPPFGVTPPTRMTADRWFQPAPAGLDLSDAWVSYTATNPVFVYGSVVDNGVPGSPNGDQTFVSAVDDVGVPPASSGPTTHTFDVTLEDFSIRFSPAPTNIKPGDRVTLRISRLNGVHGFQLTGPSFENLVPNTDLSRGPVTRTFDVTAQGTYSYFCTVTTCGEGHGVMFGTFDVGTGGGGDGPRYGVERRRARFRRRTLLHFGDGSVG